VEIEDASATFESETGVKQGDNLSPLLFLFMMQVFIELLPKEKNWPGGLTFRTRHDGIITGRARHMGGVKVPQNVTKSENATPEIHTFTFGQGLYADDAGFLFRTKEELVRATNIIYPLLERLGLMMHVGRGDKKSKTEALFLPGNGRKYEDGDTSRFAVDTDGFIDFTKEFKYLGSIISSDGTDDADIDNRINQASKMFGCLRKRMLGNKRVAFKTKRIMYECYVFGTLFYGSECWRLTAKSLSRLQTFHRRCVRTMAGENRWTTWKYRITAFDLEQKLGLRDIQSYWAERHLRWLGHVVRMERWRLPLKILTAWIYKEKGSKQTTCYNTYGRSVTKYAFACVLKNPTLTGLVRESLRREAEFKTAEGKKFSRAKLKTNKYWEHDHNWYRLALDRDVWKKEVVEKAKVHYNYKHPELTLDPTAPSSPTSTTPPPTPPSTPEKDAWDTWISTDQPEIRAELEAWFPPSPPAAPAPPAPTTKTTIINKTKNKRPSYNSTCSLHTFTET